MVGSTGRLFSVIPLATGILRERNQAGGGGKGRGQNRLAKAGAGKEEGTLRGGCLAGAGLAAFTQNGVAVSQLAADNSVRTRGGHRSGGQAPDAVHLPLAGSRAYLSLSVIVDLGRAAERPGRAGGSEVRDAAEAPGDSSALLVHKQDRGLQLMRERYLGWDRLVIRLGVWLVVWEKMQETQGGGRRSGQPKRKHS